MALPLVGVLGAEPDTLLGLCGPSTRLSVAQAAKPSPGLLRINYLSRAMHNGVSWATVAHHSPSDPDRLGMAA